jgi:hypothetical protein
VCCLVFVLDVLSFLLVCGSVLVGVDFVFLWFVFCLFLFCCVVVCVVVFV